MSTSKYFKIKNNESTALSKLYFIKAAHTAISRWLGEMDGETAEEDWRIYTHSFKFDGKISGPSFKKVFGSSQGSIYHKR